MSSRCFLPRIGLVLVACALLSAGLADAGKKVKPRDLLLPSKGFPGISDEQLALKEVPNAAGAPAAVLLEAEEYDWEGLKFVRNTYFRRVKILTEDGIEDHGDFVLSLEGDWRVQRVEARTVLADGTTIDASDDVKRERSEDKQYQRVSVAFPRVEKGAILDVRVELAANAWWGVSPWLLQEDVPVLDSRLIVIPPPGLRFRTAMVGLPQDAAKPMNVNVPPSRRATIWRFQNMSPLPDEPFMPPLMDASAKMILILDSYKDSIQYLPIASSWAEFGKWMTEDVWDAWMGRSGAQITALAEQAVAGVEGREARAEALRRALREKVRVDSWTDGKYHDTPDEVLEEGYGTTGDLSGALVAMMRAVGIDAYPALTRRRNTGSFPAEIPIPALFNDVVIYLPGEAGGEWMTAAEDLPVGVLPASLTGVLAFPLDGEASAPVPIPDLKASDVRTHREVDATIMGDGAISARSTFEFGGAKASAWRNRFEGESEEECRDIVLHRLLGNVGGAEIESMTIEGREPGSANLKVDVSWSASNFATRAGKRLLFEPMLHDRERPDAWTGGERRFPVLLGSAYETVDEYTFHLPEQAGEVTLPSTEKKTAGPVGEYDVVYESDGSTVRVKRSMRLDRYGFPANAYSGLSRWFSSIAERDAEPVVVALD